MKVQSAISTLAAALTTYGDTQRLSEMQAGTENKTLIAMPYVGAVPVNLSGPIKVLDLVTAIWEGHNYNSLIGPTALGVLKSCSWLTAYGTIKLYRFGSKNTTDLIFQYKGNLEKPVVVHYVPGADVKADTNGIIFDAIDMAITPDTDNKCNWVLNCQLVIVGCRSHPGIELLDKDIVLVPEI